MKTIAGNRKMNDVFMLIEDVLGLLIFMGIYCM